MGSLEDVEAAMEEVPLMTTAPAESGSSGPEQGANSPPSGEIPSSSGTCRICLETSPLEELEEACACKGSQQVSIIKNFHKTVLTWPLPRSPLAIL
jgi:hypothetical protein